MATANAGDAIWISVLPDMSKFGKEMQRTTGPAAEKSGESVGSRMSRGIGKTLKRGAAVAAAGGAAAIGLSLVKGFQRLQGIDQAEAKLTGLGHSAKSVQGIMDNALASVKGTAFGLDAAATTAAGAVAAGIKPGQQLERTLKLVGDTATIAGVGMDEMGAIFNKVASSDMIQGDVLAQLGDKGIPVLQMLGKEMGVSAAEVRKLASEGKVDFATFQNAMEEGLGGAAQESGKTFSGAVANTQAALGRLGAQILGPIFKRIPNILEGVMGRIDSLGPVAERAGVLIGSAFAKAGEVLRARVIPPVKAFGGFVRDDVVPAVEDLGSWLKENVDALKIVAAVIGTATAAYLIYNTTVGVVTAATKAWAAIQRVLNTQLKLNPIGLVVTAIALLVAGLVVAYKRSDRFREIVDKAWAAIRKAISRAWDGYIKPALKAFWSFIQKDLIPVVRFLWSKVIQPVFRQIGRIIREVWKVFIQPALKAWWYYISEILFPIVRALWQNVVRPVMEKVGGKIRDVWQNWVRPAFKAIAGFITDTLIPAFRKARDRITEFWDKIKDAAKTPVGFVINTIWNNGLRKMIGMIPGVDTPARVEGFADGGWTGPGSKHQPAGIVHADEFVLSKRARNSLESMRPGWLDRMNSTGAWPGYANGGRVWPVPGRQISTYSGHDGVDINRGSGWDDYGDPIWAAAGGRVSYVGSGRGYGLATFIRGPYGELVYGHMSHATRRAGMGVNAGDLIGNVGNTGRSSAPHLHFGFPGGTYAQALGFLQGADVSGGKEGGGGGFRALIKAAREVWRGIKGMAAGGWSGLMKSGAGRMGGMVKDWINDKIPGPGPIPGGIFDRGGWLMPGMAAVNTSQKPEPVFSGDQWSTLRASAMYGEVASRTGMGGHGGVRGLSRVETAVTDQTQMLNRRLAAIESAVSRQGQEFAAVLDGRSAQAARQAFVGGAR